MNYIFHSSQSIQDKGLTPEVLTVINELDKNKLSKSDLISIRKIHRLKAYDLDEKQLPHVENVLVDNDGYKVPTRIYHPNNLKNRSLIIFIHGGSWCFCNLDTHDRLCRYLSHHSQAVVMAIDYRLAPEHPYPQGLIDCLSVLKWCQQNEHRLGIDLLKINVCGESAGGNLSAAICHHLKDKKQLMPKRQILLYPIVDANNFNRKSHKRFGKGYYFELSNLRKSVSLYLPDKSNSTDVMVSPIYDEDFTELPETIIVLAECDLTRDEGYAYAKVLHDAGNQVVCHEFQGMVHAFISMAGKVPQGQNAIHLVCDVIKQDGSII